jgi:PPK2 family polyphosphate:nucleotide phosphotransferase
LKNADYTRYLVPPGKAFSLGTVDPDDTQGYPGKDLARKQLRASLKRTSTLQERLYAESERSVLLVVQAMDGGGKDSTIRRVFEGLNPQGCYVVNFKVPTTQELAHDFLWRVHRQVPGKGYIAVFNRSHYEDVLVTRVRGLAPAELIEERYEHINSFEKLLHDHGTRLVKVFLHISKEYQLERIRRRLERPDKRWKFDPKDLEERELWNSYQQAYELMLNRCSTEHAPWYVIPAQHKWFRSLLVSRLLVDTLERMDPQYPQSAFGPEDFTPQSLS